MNRLPHFITQSLNHFFFFKKKLHLISFFVHYSVIQLRYFQWNYFLNNLSLLNGLLRLVCLLMVHSYFILIIDQWTVGMLGSYIFWWHMFCNKSFYIASYGVPIHCFFWTPSFFLQTSLLINSVSFCLDAWIFCHLLHTSWITCFRVSGHFLCFFGCCKCWLPWISRVMYQTRPE